MESLCSGDSVAAMDIPLLLVTLAVFGAAIMAGQREYRRLVRRWPEVTLAGFHKTPGWIRFVLLGLTVISAVGLYFVLNRDRLMMMPDWLDLALPCLTHGFGAALFGLLAGLAGAAYRREKRPDTRALLLTASLCQAALLVSQAWILRYVADELSDTEYSGDMLPQTSSSSCAAATGANVAGLLGLDFSERDMARLMGTRACGTSTPSIIRGLRRAGLEARFLEQDPGRPDLLPLPAILLVNHPRAGRESHAVAAVKYWPDQGTLEIWDPLEGRVLVAKKDLSEFWAGHGVTVKRPAL